MRMRRTRLTGLMGERSVRTLSWSTEQNRIEWQSGWSFLAFATESLNHPQKALIYYQQKALTLNATSHQISKAIWCRKRSNVFRVAVFMASYSTIRFTFAGDGESLTLCLFQGGIPTAHHSWEMLKGVASAIVIRLTWGTDWLCELPGINSLNYSNAKKCFYLLTRELNSQQTLGGRQEITFITISVRVAKDTKLVLVITTGFQL